jgi:hypothetical protein
MEEDDVLNSIGEMGDVDLRLPQDLLETILQVLSEGGYDVARLYIDKFDDSSDKNEIQRILATCQQCNLTPDFAAEVFRRLNKDELGIS